MRPAPVIEALALLLAGLLALAPAATRAGTDFMAIPLDGQLQAASAELAADGVARLALTLTAKADLGPASVRLVLPAGLSLEPGSAPAETRVAALRSGQSTELHWQVRAGAYAPLLVLAGVTLRDEKGLHESKAYAFQFNPQLVPQPVRRIVRDAQGHPVSVH